MAVYGAIFVLTAGAIFHALGMYRGVWRYASLSDLTAVVESATLAILAAVPLVFLINRLAEVPRSVPLIQWFVLVILLGGPRFAYRLLRNKHWLLRNRRLAFLAHSGTACAPEDAHRQVPVLLIGACDGAALFIRAMNGDPEAPYRVVGILDDGGEHRGRSIHNVAVLGGTGQLPAAIDQLRARGLCPQRLIIANPPGRPGGEMLRHLLEQAGTLGLTVARLPSLVEFKEAVNDGTKVELKPIALEDLLGRPQAVLDRAAIDRLIAGRRVLVTGAGGTIGSELVRQIAALRPAQLVLLDSSEFNLYSIDLELHERHPELPRRAVLCNVRDGDHVARVFADCRPELVFHAAALKHVPMVELNPGEGVLTNVLGTRHVADAAARHGALAMVQISTDKAVKPTSVMGASKRLAEFYCQALDLARGGGGHRQPSPRFMTVRFGNVLGSSGSVVPLFQRQLARGGPLTVTHPEIKRYFMTVREAVELVLQASAHGIEHPEERGRIFVLDMGEPVRIVDVARQIIRLAGLRPEVDVPIKFVGLRHGEKLYEELFDDEEARFPTAVDGVLIAASRSIELDVLNRFFDHLAGAARRRDGETLQRLIGEILPGYRGAPAARADPSGGERRRAGPEADVEAPVRPPVAALSGWNRVIHPTAWPLLQSVAATPAPPSGGSQP